MGRKKRGKRSVPPPPSQSERRASLVDVEGSLAPPKLDVDGTWVGPVPEPEAVTADFDAESNEAVASRSDEPADATPHEARAAEDGREPADATPHEARAAEDARESAAGEDVEPEPPTPVVEGPTATGSWNEASRPLAPESTGDAVPASGVESPRAPESFPPRRCRILAFGGAKGGVGKSVLAANVAIYLASIGRRVLVVDADRGASGSSALVGGPEAPSPGQYPTAVPQLELRITGLDEALRGRRAPARGARLWAELRDAPFDYAVVDLGSLTSRPAIDAFLDADLAVLVTIPEPTALSSTHRLIARAFLRRLTRELRARSTSIAGRPGASSGGPRRDDLRVLAETVHRLGGCPAPLDLWRVLDDEGQPLADLVRERMEAFHPHVVLNQTRLRADLELGDALPTVLRRRLGITIEYLGHVEHDDTVWSAVRARKLLLIESPGTKASKNVEKIARRLLGLESGKIRPAQRTVPAESHHDLLEVERGATDEEIRRAYKRAKGIYAPDALVCHALFTPEELEHVRARLDEAFDVLLDPSRRRPYELSVFPPSPEHEDAAVAARSGEEPLPPMPEITPETDFTGPLLRAVRLARGMRLEDIAARTKIGVGHLAAIEADDFGALPAAVYVRGFVGEFAKMLKLDATQVAQTYVRRYRRYLEERAGATR